jgi:uncharacterized damage-inducible protein DinB
VNIAQSIVADFERDAALSRSLLEAVPEDKLDWKPHEKSRTLGELAGHIAECPSWTGSMLEDSMDFAELKDYQPFVPASKQELLENLEQNRAQFAPALDGKDDEFMRATWTMKMGGQVLLQQPRADVIRDIILGHNAHHRGQLTVYLRLLDAQVPKTFGPTADFPDF